jgi:hypothetical protein
MVIVCAWCQKYMGSKEPLQDPAVSHGICSACVERQSLTDTAVVVVSPARVSTIPLLQTLLRGAPDVTIVVDRRTRERRNGGSNGNGNGNGHGRASFGTIDRRTDDRRHLNALYLV